MTRPSEATQLLREVLEAVDEDNLYGDILVRIRQFLKEPREELPWRKALEEYEGAHSHYLHSPGKGSVNGELDKCLNARADLIAAVEAELDRALDSEMDKLLAMPQDRIEAALRLEGRDPKDAGTIAKQAAELGILKAELAQCRRDAAGLLRRARDYVTAHHMHTMVWRDGKLLLEEPCPRCDLVKAMDAAIDDEMKSGR